jgi:hypothetical protein
MDWAKRNISGLHGNDAYGYIMSMTLVMDGVRRTQVMRSPMSAMVMPMPAVMPVLSAKPAKPRAASEAGARFHRQS